MTRPLKELTEAAQKVAGGDLEVNIDCESKDEVGVLAGQRATDGKSPAALH